MSNFGLGNIVFEAPVGHWVIGPSQSPSVGGVGTAAAGGTEKSQMGNTREAGRGLGSERVSKLAAATRPKFRNGIARFRTNISIII